HEDSAVITQKLSETLHLKVGDTLEVKNSNGFRGTVTITGIAENYVADFLFLSPKLYTDTFGEIPEYREIYATLADTGETFRTEFTEKMLGSDNVLLLLFNQTMQETFNNTVKNIDYIVMVLIVSAGALAMIVLYNLTNINICERKKELATIKVLGFHQREVALYIYRETMILCLIGIAVGLVLGIFLHAFVISTAEVDAVMFGRTIYPLSYVYAGAVTLFFTLLVDVIMLRKLRGIDMVESMKANE
ncbi:MAG: ABC transporter permease, partial [Oscillospiraceae bacterium]